MSCSSSDSTSIRKQASSSQTGFSSCGRILLVYLEPATESFKTQDERIPDKDSQDSADVSEANLDIRICLTVEIRGVETRRAM